MALSRLRLPTVGWSLGLTASLLICLWFACMSAGDPSSLTALYTDSLAKGHAYLDIAPDPRLLALSNPFDPDSNRGYRLLDASLYGGKYYLYYGIVPFATLLVPWKWATGSIMSDAYAIGLFSAGAFLSFALILRDVARRYFPETSGLVLGGAVLTAALGSGALQLIRYPRIYELAIASALFYQSIAVFACYWALHRERQTTVALVVANLASALAVGSRPSHIVVALVVAGFSWWRAVSVDRAPGRITRLGLIFGPAAVVGLLLAYYNWVRFGSPLDFGYKYLLLDVKNFATDFNHPRYIKFNLWQYWVGMPRWSGWFPFFEQPAEGPFAKPVGYYGLEQAYGILFVAPVVFFVFALPFVWKRVPVSVRCFLILVILIGVVNVLFVSTMNGAVYRYESDFLPYLVLGGVLTAVASGAQWNRGLVRVFATGGVCAVLVYTMLSSACASFALYDLTADLNPRAFLTLSKIFNAPRFLVERLLKSPLHQYEVKLKLPQNKFGQVEPLLVSGRQGLQDFLYLYYASSRGIQIGFEAIGRGGPVSDILTVDYAQPAKIELVWGPDLPPPGSWQYAGAPDQQVARFRRKLHVTFNGVTALDCWVNFHSPKASYQWGRSHDDAAFGNNFSGELSVRKRTLELVAFRSLEMSSAQGSIELELEPATSANGSPEPLVSVGYKNRFQMLTVLQVDDHTAFFRVLGSGLPQAQELSGSAAFERKKKHTLVFDAGGLLPPRELIEREGQEGLNAPNHVRLTVDGIVVFEGNLPAPEVGLEAVVVGRNSTLTTGVAEHFSGIIHSQRIP